MKAWIYMATERVGGPGAVRTLARHGGLWVPGNLIGKWARVIRPGDALLVLWRRTREETVGEMIGAATAAEPVRAWGDSTWLSTVGTDDPLFGAARSLGYGGPRNYLTMALLAGWTEDEYQVRELLSAEYPRLRLQPGAHYDGLPASSLVGPLPAEGLPRHEVTEIPLLARITIDPNVLGGKPIIRGLRIAVEQILEWMELGATPAEILEAFPSLEPDDIRACLAYARRLVGNEEIHPPLKLS